GEGQLHADVRAAWEAMRRSYGDAAPQREVIVGNSLGTALAARLAAEEQPEQLVLIAPYTSMKALAAEHYPWVPRAVLRYPLATEDWIGRVRAPILLAHGGRDTLIEPDHSRRLQQLAPHAQLLLVPEARHHDLQAFPEYRDALWAAVRGRGARGRALSPAAAGRSAGRRRARGTAWSAGPSRAAGRPCAAPADG
ncbi:MAG: hypothetical protein ACK51Z_19080, partial [Pseudomonadota bacterium]